MKKIFFLLILIIICLFKINYNQFETKYNPIYYTKLNVNESLDDVQCPIPRKDRVANYTGIQCVWSSIETLGRWAEEPKLINPPLTSRSNCKSYSDPHRAGLLLESLNVKFVQATNREKCLELIRIAMKEKRGCLWNIKGHAMVLVHFDEQNNIFKWIDNSDSSLNVQTGTIDRFNQVFQNWILVIYADKDIIKYKNYKADNLKIIDENDKEIIIDKNYFQYPEKYLEIN